MEHAQQLKFSFIQKKASSVSELFLKILFTFQKWFCLCVFSAGFVLWQILDKHTLEQDFHLNASSQLRWKPEVTQARNMSIGKHQHCCVTFEI